MTWTKAAADAISYRRMYFLAVEIMASETAEERVRRSARRLARVLEEVIDMPIADAHLLARARKRFGELVRALEAITVEAIVIEQKLAPDRENDRALAIV